MSSSPTSDTRDPIFPSLFSECRFFLEDSWYAVISNSAIFKFDPLPLMYCVVREVNVVILFRTWAAWRLCGSAYVCACGILDELYAVTWHLNGLIWSK